MTDQITISIPARELLIAAKARLATFPEVDLNSDGECPDNKAMRIRSLQETHAEEMARFLSNNPEPFWPWDKARRKSYIERLKNAHKFQMDDLLAGNDPTSRSFKHFSLNRMTRRYDIINLITQCECLPHATISISQDMVWEIFGDDLDKCRNEKQ